MADRASTERRFSLREAFLADPGPAAMLALTAVIFAPVLMGGETLYFRDLYSNFMPLKEVFRDTVLDGQLPLINPRLHGGQPYLANVATGTLYPGNIVFLALPFVFAFNLLIAGQFFIGGVTSYFLGRELKLSMAASLVTALVFSLCGVSLSQINLLNQFLAFSWIPLQLLLWHRWLTSGGRAPLVGLVAVSTAQFMAGAPEVSLIAFATLLFWSWGFQSTEVGHRTGIGRWLALLVLVLGITAVQILPTAELVSASSRGAGMAGGTAAVWSLHPMRLVELVYPGVFGAAHTLRDADYWGRGLVDSGFPYLISVYVGWATLLFAGFGAWRGGRGCTISTRFRAVLALLAGGGMLLALGRHLPGFSVIFEHLPGASVFRFPSKFALASVVPMALLAGCGVHRVFSSSQPPENHTSCSRRWVVAAWAVWAVTAGMTLALLVSPTSRAAVIEWLFRQPADAASMEGFLRSLIHAAVVLLTCCLLLTAGRPGRRSWLGWAAAAVVLLDLGIAGGRLNPSTPPEILREPTPAAQLALTHIGDGRLFSDVLPSGIVINAPTNDVVWRYRFNLEVLESELGANFGIPVILHEDLPRMAPLELMTLRQLVLTLPWERRVPLLSAAGVSLVLTSSPVVHDDLELISAVPNRGAVPRFLYRNLALPARVRTLTDVRLAGTDAQAIDLLTAADFDPREAVVLHLGDDGAPELDTPHAAACDPRVTVETATATLLRIKLNSACGTVVCTDRTLTPGWRARIDGAEAEVERANLAFMAVRAPAGEHLVELAYRPRSLRFGMWIGLLSMVALCLATFVPARPS
jgi:hypothetical protein